MEHGDFRQYRSYGQVLYDLLTIVYSEFPHNVDTEGKPCKKIAACFAGCVVRGGHLKHGIRNELTSVMSDKTNELSLWKDGAHPFNLVRDCYSFVPE